MPNMPNLTNFQVKGWKYDESKHCLKKKREKKLIFSWHKPHFVICLNIDPKFFCYILIHCFILLTLLVCILFLHLKILMLGLEIFPTLFPNSYIKLCYKGTILFQKKSYQKNLQTNFWIFWLIYYEKMCRILEQICRILVLQDMPNCMPNFRHTYDEGRPSLIWVEL